jgi:hypothetical protein
MIVAMVAASAMIVAMSAGQSPPIRANTMKSASTSMPRYASTVSVMPGHVVRRSATRPSRARACSVYWTTVRRRAASARRSDENRRTRLCVCSGPNSASSSAISSVVSTTFGDISTPIGSRFDPVVSRRTLRFTARSIRAADAARRSASTSSASRSTVDPRSGEYCTIGATTRCAAVSRATIPSPRMMNAGMIASRMTAVSTRPV